LEVFQVHAKLEIPVRRNQIMQRVHRVLLVASITLVLVGSFYPTLGLGDAAGDFDRLSDRCAAHLEAGDLEKAERAALKLKAIAENRLTDDPPTMIVALETLGDVYFAQKRFEEGEHLSMRALRLREQTQGAEHLDVARALNDLGTLYYDRVLRSAGPSTRPLHMLALEIEPDAESFLKRALAIREKLLGEEHLAVADTHITLGYLYEAQRRYDEANAHHLRSLEIREKLQGKDHLDVATQLSHLASMYRSQGRYPEAEPLYQRALSIKREKLGEQHGDVMRVRVNMMIMEDWRDQGIVDPDSFFDKKSLNEAWEAAAETVYYVANAQGVIVNYAHFLSVYPDDARAEELRTKLENMIVNVRHFPNVIREHPASLPFANGMAMNAGGVIGTDGNMNLRDVANRGFLAPHEANEEPSTEVLSSRAKAYLQVRTGVTLEETTSVLGEPDDAFEQSGPQTAYQRTCFYALDGDRTAILWFDAVDKLSAKHVADLRYDKGKVEAKRRAQIDRATALRENRDFANALAAYQEADMKLIVEVVSDKANLIKDGQVLKTVSMNDRLTVIEVDGEWLLVETELTSRTPAEAGDSYVIALPIRGRISASHVK
jgi:tetratricopeptide (TPR) repeat protein